MRKRASREAVDIEKHTHWVPLAEKPSLPMPYPLWVSLGQPPLGPLMCPPFTEEQTGERGDRCARMASPWCWCAEGTDGLGPSQSSLPPQGTVGWAWLAEVIPLVTMNWNTEEKDLRRCSTPSYRPGFSVGPFHKHEVMLPTLAHDFPP